MPVAVVNTSGAQKAEDLSTIFNTRIIIIYIAIVYRSSITGAEGKTLQAACPVLSFFICTSSVENTHTHDCFNERHFSHRKTTSDKSGTYKAKHKVNFHFFLLKISLCSRVSRGPIYINVRMHKTYVGMLARSLKNLKPEICILYFSYPVQVLNCTRWSFYLFTNIKNDKKYCVSQSIPADACLCLNTICSFTFRLETFEPSKSLFL